MLNRKVSAFFALVIGLGLICSCTYQNASVPLQGRHLVEPGIIKDPSIVHGRLSNGFQYFLVRNNTPENKVNIHLDVFAGSINETDGQEGVAHYLEHMLFNGSTHFKPGELVRYFQSIGMDFGADANARTSFYNTVYDLSLPRGDLKTLSDAFVVIQDYAEGALLLESEIERERGIILAEKRERDSARYRTFKKSLEFELPSSVYSKRFPIGTLETIKKTDRRILKSFYDRWYRPDNMVLLVVGDVDPEEVQPLIIKKFSGILPRGKLPLSGSMVKWNPHQGNKPFYYHEPEAGSTDVSIECISYIPFEPETPDTLKLRTVQSIASTILNNRLAQMITSQEAAFSGASVYIGEFLRHAFVSAVSATCGPDQWEMTISQLEKALRQAEEHGFTSRELQRVKAEFISFLEREAASSESRRTPKIAGRLISAIEQKKLILSPQQRLELLKPFITSLSLAQVEKVFKEAWGRDHRLISITGNARIKSDNPEASILKQYEESRAQTVIPLLETELKTFPYLPKPENRARIRIRKENVEDLGITCIDYQNHIRLNLKKTVFKKNEFLYKVRFGQGKKSEPRAAPGLADLSETVVRLSGFNKLNADELEESLAGRKISFEFDVKENSFTLSGSGDPEELGLMFQLIFHFFNDPGFRPEALELAKTLYRQKYNERLNTPDGMMQIEGKAFLAGNDSRFGLQPPHVIDGYSLEQIKDWIGPLLQSAPVEISIVGDIDISKAVLAAEDYLGGLGPRPVEGLSEGETETISFPRGQKTTYEIDTRINSGLIHLAFLTDDFWNIGQTRRLSILARVLSERLRLTVREELAESYSPYAYNDPSLAYDGYGVLHVGINVKPENHAFVYRKLEEIFQTLSAEGISEAETELALKSVLSHLEIVRKTNSYWLNSVLAGSSVYPQKYEWSHTMLEDYRSISAKDLNSLSKKYLDLNEGATIFIKPKNGAD